VCVEYMIFLYKSPLTTGSGGAWRGMTVKVMKKWIPTTGSGVIGRVILFYILYTRTFFSRAPPRLDKRWKLNINFSAGHCFFGKGILNPFLTAVATAACNEKRGFGHNVYICIRCTLFSVAPKVYTSSAFIFYLETILFPTGGRNTLGAKQCCQLVPFCLYNGIVLQNLICIYYVVTQNGMVVRKYNNGRRNIFKYLPFDIFTTPYFMS